MKIRVRRITALLLAVSLTAAAGNLDYKIPHVFAEEAVDASGETAEEPQTQAPTEAPQPETPAPQPETPAPQPETPAPEPETPAPQPETPAPQPETPAPQPETQAPTEAPQTEMQTAGETSQPESASEVQTETDAGTPETQNELVQETETEAKTRSLSRKVGSATFRITLPKGKEVPKTAVLDVDVTKAKNDTANLRKAESLLKSGFKVVAGARFYALHLYDGSEEIRIPKGTKVEYSREDGLSLGMESFRQAAFHVLDMSGKSASQIDAETTLTSGGLTLTKASFTTSGALTSFSIVGTQNRENDGVLIKQKNLREDMKSAADYTIVAEEYEGEAGEDILTADSDTVSAADSSASGEEALSAPELLEKLSEYSLKLGNARGEKDLVIVNLYTDKNGKVLTSSNDSQDPLKEVLTKDGEIDVTDRTVVINVIAVNTGANTVELPRIDVVVRKDGKIRKVHGKENPELSGRVVYNVTSLAAGTEGTWRLAPYTGKILVKDRAVGNYIAPEAEITFEKNLIGGAYAEKVAVVGKVISATVTAELPKEKQTEAPTEAVTEAVTEAPTEAVTEAVTEAPTEAVTEAVTEAPTEAVTEAETEAPTEAATEAPTEAVTEAVTEAAAEIPTEAETERQTEALTEAATETEASAIEEILTAAVFTAEETETEAETEAETETEAVEETEAETEPEEEIETEAETEAETEQLYQAAEDGEGLAGGAEEGTVMVSKTDGKEPAANPVPDAELALYNTEELKTADGETIEAETLLKTWTTAADPEDISAWILPDGKYVIRETQTPEGYAKAWDKEYIPKTGKIDPEDEKESVLEESIEIVDTQIGPVPEEFPKVAVKDSEDDSFLSGISISINKKVVTTVTDSEGTETVTEEDQGEVASFDSESDYAAISLSGFCKEVSPPVTDENNNTTKTDVVLTISEKSLAPDHYFDGKYETSLKASWDEETKAPKIDYTESEADGIAEQDSQDGSWKLTFLQKKITPFTAVSYKTETTTVVSGTEFQILGSDGTKVLTPGTDYTVTGATVSGNKVVIGSGKATITLKNEDEIKALSEPGKSLTVSWVTIPDNYYVVSSSSKTGYVNFETPENTIYLGEKTAVGTVTVTRKTRYLSNGTLNPTDNEEYYYFTLTKANDPDFTPVTKSLKVSIYNSKSSGTISFDNLEEGDYYLKETDSTGSSVYTDPDLVQIQYKHTYLNSEGKWKVQPAQGIPISIKLNKSDSDTSATVPDIHTVEYRNVYSASDTSSGSFKVKVRVVDGNNKDLGVTLTAGYTVKWSTNGKNWKINPQPTLVLNNASSAISKKYTIPFPADDKNVSIKVKLVSLTDENGNNVLGQYTLVDDNNYTRLSSYQKTISLVNGVTDGLVTFTLKKGSSSQETAQLTLTKAVTYQKVPMRVNATYYLGIFTDPAHTKLLFKKALSLSNASSRTSTLKINLYKLKNSSHSITLYFAETDSKGKVVSGGAKTGYNISLSRDSVTLSPTNAEASVVLTNDIIKGSKTEKRLTNPGSGFAGDRSALAEAQDLANSESLTGKKTGDETPIKPYVLAALISAALVLALAVAVLLRRRRRR